MNRSFLSLTALASLVLLLLVSLLGCGGGSATGVGTGLNDTGTLPSVAELKENQGIVLHHKAGLYVETAEGMDWKASATILDSYKLGGSEKNAVRVSDGAERNFIKIIDNQGNDRWIQDFFLATEAIGAVVLTDDTILYKGPDAAQASNTLLPQYHMVAVHPKNTSAGFVEISAYVEGGKTVVIQNLWVKAEKLTQVPKDVRAMQLYKVAMANEDPVVRNEILKSAIETGSIFTAMIKDEIDGSSPEASADDAAAVEREAGSRPVAEVKLMVEIIADDVNVRDQPNEIGSSVLQTIDKGLMAETSLQTVESYTVDGQSAVWYFIPALNGWVFGAFTAIR